MASGFEALQDPLALAGRLVRGFGSIVEIAALTMFPTREHLALGSLIPAKFVGDQRAWNGRVVLELFAETLHGGCLVPATLNQDVLHVPS